MTALQLTAYELGQRSPADHFPPESRLKIIRRDQRRTKGLPEEERRLRMVLAVQVRERFDSTSAMARAMGVHDGTIKQWLCGVRPVPDKRMDTLQSLAGGGK